MMRAKAAPRTPPRPSREADVAAVFRALARSLAVGHLREGGSGLIHAIPGAPPGRTRWDYQGGPIDHPTTIEIGGRVALYRFELLALRPQDGRVEAPLPSRIEVLRHRSEPRIDAPDDVWLRYTDARSNVTVRRRVLDVSVHGLSLAVGNAPADWRSGATFGDAVIEWQRRLRVCVRATVRHLSVRAGDGTLVSGCSLAFESEDDRQHWEVEVDGLLHPRTRRGGHWARDTWELFQRSGYFELSNKNPSAFAPIERSFAHASRRLGGAPELGVQVVWPSSRGIEASASAVELNSNAAFLFHVARRHGNPPQGVTGRTILHDVYTRILQWVHRRPSFEWLVVWVQDAGRFSRRLHLDFTLRYEDEHDACVVPFRAFELPTQALAPAPVADVAVRDATSEELASLSRHCARTLPPAFVAAHALGPDRLGEERFEAWGEASLRRGRRVLVLERGGVVERAAVIEWAEPGIHLFGLLDVVRTFDLVARPAVGGREVLLAHVAHQLELVGTRSFIYACDPVQTCPKGAVDLGLTHCTVVRRPLLAPLLEHVWHLTMGDGE